MIRIVTRLFYCYGVMVLVITAQGYAYDPVVDWDECPASVTGPDAEFAPLPEFIQNTVGSPVTSWPVVGDYDFCAYMDTFYCQLSPLGGLVPEMEDIAALTRCIDGDINGTLDLMADPPFTSNGILDGQYELGILAAVLNDPTHPLHGDAHTAVQNNFIYFKDAIQTSLSDQGYLGLMPLMCPYFIGSLSMTLAGYATMGDATTYEALDELLTLLEDIGLAPPPGGSASAASSVPEVGPEEDIDGDNLTSREEHDILVLLFGYTGPEYVNAALDPEQPGLSVTPVTGLDALGYEGGPFTPVSETYTVSNYFASSINWTASVTMPWLTVSPESGTLTPSGSTTITVSLNTNATLLSPGDYSDTLSIVPDVYGTTIRDIFLTVLPIPGEISVTDTILPDNDHDMPFGDTVITLSYAEQVTVTNVDAVYDLIIDGVELESVLFSLGDTGFTLDNLPAFPVTLAPGSAFTFDVLFDPLGEGLHEDMIVINSNDALAPEVTVSLSADAAWDALQVSPETEFAAQGLEGGPFTPTSTTYTITNDGANPMNWSVTGPAWLTLTPDFGALNGGQSMNITVAVNATAETIPTGYHTGTLTFTNGNTLLTKTRETALVVVPETGGANTVTDSILPVDDHQLPFGDVYVGTSRTEVVAIHNTSTVDDLVVEDISLDSMYYTEDFEDGLAQNWSPSDPSHWNVTAGQYYASDPTFDGYMQSLLLEGSWLNAIFEVTILQQSMNSWSMLVVRASDDFVFNVSGSGVCLLMYGFGYYEIYMQTDGYAMHGPSDLCPDLFAGIPRHMRITMEDDLLQFYVNGNWITRLILNDVQEAGRIGLGGFTKPSELSTYYFDDIRVYQGSQFRFESLPALPITLAPSEFLAVDVLFEPVKRGFHQDVMHIATNNVFEPYVDVMLTGTGISNKRYVKMDGDDANDGLSWATAKATIQAALEIADVGDDIWVAAGTYYPTSSNGMDPGNERTYHFRLKEGVFLYGGFNGTETSLEQRDWETNFTLLSGDVNEPGIDQDNCYRIIYNNERLYTEYPYHLDGFTIRSFQSLAVEPFTFLNGRGLYGYYDNLTVANCVFKYNMVYENAAGANIEGYKVQLINCHFENNRANDYRGAGLYIKAYNATLTNCEFRDNLLGPEPWDFSSEGFGGASFLTCYNKGVLDGCLFINNAVSEVDSGMGGALLLDSGAFTVDNCIFESNSLVNTYSSYVNGGGAIAASDCTLSIRNSIFNGNQTNGNYGGSAVFSPFLILSVADQNVSIVNSTFYENISSIGVVSTLSLDGIAETNLINCIIYNNSTNNIVDYNSSTTITYSNVEGGFTGTGNIDADPMFVNAATGDFRLQLGSPSINTGDPAGVPPAPETDIVGTIRPQDGVVDMGAYEYDVTPPVVTLSLLSPAQTGVDEVQFNVSFDESVAMPDTTDFVVTGTLSGTISITGSEADYVVTVSLSAPDTDGTVGIRLLPGVVFDLTGNPCSGGVSSLCQIFNWHGFQVEPANARLYDGDSHTLSVLPDCGADNISYQWKWDDGAKGINDGPQTQNWVIDEITLSMAGAYWCEAVYDDTVYATTPATIEVEPSLEITIMPAGAEKEIGENHEFTIEAVGGYAPLTYDWMKDGIPIPGAPDAPIYALSNLTEEDSGYYWVTVYDSNTAEIRSLSARLLVGIDLPLTGLLGILATATTLLFVGISTIKPRRKT